MLKRTVRSVLENEVVEKCGTCIYYFNCSYRISSDKFILQCDDFEGKPRRNFNGAAPAKGLCSNCAKACDCRLPKSATGVWHCEEYE